MADRFDDLVSAAKKRERKNSDHREQDYIRDLRPAKWGCEPKLHGSNFALPMSALGQKRTSEHVQSMSALPPTAFFVTQEDAQASTTLKSLKISSHVSSLW
jgi:hypothetical protein